MEPTSVVPNVGGEEAFFGKEFVSEVDECEYAYADDGESGGS